jgi:hypothetical protein
MLPLVFDNDGCDALTVQCETACLNEVCAPDLVRSLVDSV